MVEGQIRFWTGTSLWSLSAIVAVSLYVGIAGTTLASIAVAVGIAVCLEVGKVLCYRRGGWHRLIAMVLSIFTILGIVGGSLIALETRTEQSVAYRVQSLHESRAYRDLLGQREGLQSELEGLLARIKGTPSTWVTLSLKLVDSASKIREELAVAEGNLTRLEDTAREGAGGNTTDLFATLGKLVGQEGEKIESILVLVLAVMVELTAFALVGSRAVPATEVMTPMKDRVGPTQARSQSPKEVTSADDRAPMSGMAGQTGQVTSDDYLRVALEHPKRPYLLGRQKVCEKLGITQTEAREFIEELLKDGKVRRESKYFVSVGAT